MKIEDTKHLKSGEALICTQSIPDTSIKRGRVFYFVSYYKRKPKQPTLYLSDIPLKSPTPSFSKWINTCKPYDPAIIEYLETAQNLREQKINKVLE